MLLLAMVQKFYLGKGTFPLERICVGHRPQVNLVIQCYDGILALLETHCSQKVVQSLASVHLADSVASVHSSEFSSYGASVARSLPSKPALVAQRSNISVLTDSTEPSTVEDRRNLLIVRTPFNLLG